MYEILTKKKSSKFFHQPTQDVGNSMKLSCWAVDNICLQLDLFFSCYKTIQQRNCSGIQADGLFFNRYGKVLVNGFESLVYVPRPTLNIQLQGARLLVQRPLCVQRAKAGLRSKTRVSYLCFPAQCGPSTEERRWKR